MILSILRVFPRPGSTVWVGEGEDADGRVVSFGGDWRPMRDLAEALREAGSAEAWIEDWQVLAVGEPDIKEES